VSWLRKLSRIGLRSSLPLVEAMSMEAKHPNGVSLDQVRLRYRRNHASNDFDIVATCFCGNPSRTGIGTDDLEISNNVGFATIDGAIGAITDEVFKAAQVFAETDYLLLGESYLDVRRFDKSQSRWAKIDDVTWVCPECHHQLVQAGLYAIDTEYLIPLCAKCNAIMRKECRAALSEDFLR
jgi:hypothetical protein